MKKIVRAVWISALSGLAFLAACTAQNGLTRSQIRQLTKKRQALIERINQIDEMKGDVVDYDLLREEYSCYYDLFMINRKLEGVEDTLSLRRCREIDSILWERPVPLLYGGPIIDSGFDENLNIIIDDKYQRRLELERKLDSINEILKQREGSRVYGSPEVLQRYGEETRRIKKEAEQIQQQLNELNNE